MSLVMEFTPYGALKDFLLDRVTEGGKTGRRLDLTAKASLAHDLFSFANDLPTSDVMKRRRHLKQACRTRIRVVGGRHCRRDHEINDGPSISWLYLTAPLSIDFPHS